MAITEERVSIWYPIIIWVIYHMSIICEENVTINLGLDPFICCGNPLNLLVEHMYRSLNSVIVTFVSILKSFINDLLRNNLLNTPFLSMSTN